MRDPPTHPLAVRRGGKKARGPGNGSRSGTGVRTETYGYRNVAFDLLFLDVSRIKVGGC